MRLEIVEWNDAWCKSGELNWTELELAPFITQTTGWVLKENEKGIFVSSELWPGYPDHCYTVTFIPSGMIVSRTCVVEDSATLEAAASEA